MAENVHFHCYHSPKAPKPWVCLMWIVGLGNAGDGGSRKRQWEMLPMVFHRSSEQIVKRTAEEWLKGERDKEAEAASEARKRAEARLSKAQAETVAPDA